MCYNIWLMKEFVTDSFLLEARMCCSLALGKVSVESHE